MLKLRGELDGTLENYMQSLEVSQRLVQIRPDNPLWQSLMSASLLGISDISRLRNEYVQAQVIKLPEAQIFKDQLDLVNEQLEQLDKRQ